MISADHLTAHHASRLITVIAQWRRRTRAGACTTLSFADLYNWSFGEPAPIEDAGTKHPRLRLLTGSVGSS